MVRPHARHRRWKSLAVALFLLASCSQKVLLVRARNLTDRPIQVQIRYSHLPSGKAETVLPGETIMVDGIEYNTFCNLPLLRLPTSILGLSIAYPNGEVLIVDREDLAREPHRNWWIYEVRDPKPTPK